ncbi:MAG: hypothetical protein IJ370_00970 [Oscillospiraceae bacterium]|nr:hypothetical protein [Oscillospiraceae bacterium]
MRILLLSCNTGQGHNSAAYAVRDALIRRGDSVEMNNALLFLHEVYEKVVSDGHTFFYKRFPKLFGIGYRFEENHTPNFIRSQMRLGVKKFKAYMAENNFDAVISTHVFGSLLVNEYKKQTGDKILSTFISTDFTCHPGAPESEADIYFTPHPLVTPEFLENGISEDKIRPYGIPVAKQFVDRVDKADAREQLGLPKDAKIVLVACGSMGCGPIAKTASFISMKMPKALVIVACGHNERLLERLARLDRANIMPLPYTKKMHLYLAAADVFISKAGGLSTSEAIYAGVPLLYIDAVPGCETRNIEFMLGNNFATSADSPHDAANKVVGILNNPKKALYKTAACLSGMAQDPAEAICHEVENELALRQSTNDNL